MTFKRDFCEYQYYTQETLGMHIRSVHEKEHMEEEHNTHTIKTTMKVVKDIVKKETKGRYDDEIHKLVEQGRLLEIAAKENEDLTWKAFAFGMKKGTLKFVLNATLDTLPTKTNLLKGRETTSNKCKLCGGRETLKHILSFCPVALNQGHLSWRHDSIVKYIVEYLDKTKYKEYADMDGMRTSANGTILPNIGATSVKPDIVVINEESQKIFTL